MEQLVHTVPADGGVAVGGRIGSAAGAWEADAAGAWEAASA